MGALSDLAFGDVEKALAPRAVGRIVRGRYTEGSAAAGEGKAKDLLKRPMQRLGSIQRSRYVEKAVPLNPFRGNHSTGELVHAASQRTGRAIANGRFGVRAARRKNLADADRSFLDHQLKNKRLPGPLDDVGKAARDQNSSPGASIVRRGPVGPGVKPSRDATRGNGPGRFTRRSEGRDANSSPRVTRVQPRHPNGRYVSGDNDLQVIHPDGSKYRSRQPRTSALGIFKPNGGHVSRVYNGKKAEQTTFGKAYGRSNTRFGTAPSRGRRIA